MQKLHTSLLRSYTAYLHISINSSG